MTTSPAVDELLHEYGSNTFEVGFVLAFALYAVLRSALARSRTAV